MSVLDAQFNRERNNGHGDPLSITSHQRRLCRSDKLRRLHCRERAALHQPFAAGAVASQLQAGRTLGSVEEAAAAGASWLEAVRMRRPEITDCRHTVERSQ